ncbi:ubiquitin carboxyl-terminal hydrolase 34 [Senna tora]|uniref:Ubiquitin carboxyl-terminal hydrolase 34 n=1 Tax=Senna tora TaxID=362788 RepID=A0A835CE00_9FABA|nr:ubiquitin carboxyl-terminal hydrolase 34 [Senna tora]
MYVHPPSRSNQASPHQAVGQAASHNRRNGQAIRAAAAPLTRPHRAGSRGRPVNTRSHHEGHDKRREAQVHPRPQARLAPPAPATPPARHHREEHGHGGAHVRHGEDPLNVGRRVEPGEVVDGRDQDVPRQQVPRAQQEMDYVSRSVSVVLFFLSRRRDWILCCCPVVLSGPGGFFLYYYRLRSMGGRKRWCGIYAMRLVMWNNGWRENGGCGWGQQWMGDIRYALLS